jgi:hypothetical protein
LRKYGKVRGGVKSGEKCVGLKMGIGKGEDLENEEGLREGDWGYGNLYSTPCLPPFTLPRL